MFWIILGCIVTVALVVLVWCKANDLIDGIAGTILTLGLAILVVFPIVWWLVSATGGLMPNYGEGVKYGYLTKMSHHGLCWKTYEGRMQVGTGEMAALQQPFSFCVPDKDVRDQIAPLIGTGQRVGLKYRHWFWIPFRRGSSNCEIIGVEIDRVSKVTQRE